jgi:hypothetical protein
MKWLALAFFCIPAVAAQVNLSPAQYATGGYSTITWAGVGCVKSSSPAYDVWDSTSGDDGGRSVAPDVSTVFTLTCSDGSVSKVLTVGNAVPAATIPVTSGPVCYPDVAIPLKVRTISVDAVLFGGDNRVSIWTCRTATGYKNESWSWKLSDIVPWAESALAGTMDESAARAWVVANADVLPATTRAVTNTLGIHAARAVVAINGTVLTRPVYVLNADGTRGAVIAARATVGTLCDMGRRITGTNYYALPGTQTVTLCTFTAPAGVND